MSDAVGDPTVEAARPAGLTLEYPAPASTSLSLVTARLNVAEFIVLMLDHETVRPGDETTPANWPAAVKLIIERLMIRWRADNPRAREVGRAYHVGETVGLYRPAGVRCCVVQVYWEAPEPRPLATTAVCDPTIMDDIDIALAGV